MDDPTTSPVTRRSVIRLIGAALAAPAVAGPARPQSYAPAPGQVPLSGTVSVRDFGAAGNGVSDDTAAIAAAIAQVASTGQPLFVPEGTFLVDPARLLVTGSGLASRFVMFGQGPSSILKIRDGTIDSANRFLLRFTTQQDMDLIEIRDLMFDHNARGSADPVKARGDPWAFQHSHTVQIAPTAGTLKLVRFSNVTIRDPAADGFNSSFKGTASVLDFVVTDCSVIERRRLRSDICFVSLPAAAHVDRFRGDVIEIEAVAPTQGKVQLRYSNCAVKRLDFLAHTSDWLTGNVEVYFDSVTAPENVGISGVVLHATNCVFGISTDKRFNRWRALQPGSQVSNSVLLHKYDEATNSVGSLTPWSSQKFGWRTNLRLVGCESRIDDSRPVAPRGAAILGTPGVTPQARGNAALEVDRHKFDARFEMSVDADRCGRVRLVDNDYGGTLCAIRYRDDGPYALDISIEGGDFRRVKGARTIKSKAAR